MLFVGSVFVAVVAGKYFSESIYADPDSRARCDGNELFQVLKWEVTNGCISDPDVPGVYWEATCSSGTYEVSLGSTSSFCSFGEIHTGNGNYQEAECTSSGQGETTISACSDETLLIPKGVQEEIYSGCNASTPIQTINYKDDTCVYGEYSVAEDPKKEFTCDETTITVKTYEQEECGGIMTQETFTDGECVTKNGFGYVYKCVEGNIDSSANMVAVFSLGLIFNLLLTLF
eukprot:Lithocolla_globosa_v1_NODE_884_length_3130_cov_89.921951.p1 type:complete len:231 gc:universal NODE_884_length_3130_cov_89.921951:2239-2931(+)